MAAAAACCCLIQSSQRRSEACRIRVVLSLLRLSAFRLGDRSWMVRWSSASSIGPSMAGRRSVRWRAERCTARPKKHGSDDCQGCNGLRAPFAQRVHHRVLPVMCPNAPAVFRHTPPPKPADFDWVRFNLTLIFILTDYLFQTNVRSVPPWAGPSPLLCVSLFIISACLTHSVSLTMCLTHSHSRYSQYTDEEPVQALARSLASRSA